MARLALVEFILPVLDGSSEEGLAGVAADASIVKMSDGPVTTDVTGLDRSLVILRINILIMIVINVILNLMIILLLRFFWRISSV